MQVVSRSQLKGDVLLRFEKMTQIRPIVVGARRAPTIRIDFDAERVGVPSSFDAQQALFRQEGAVPRELRRVRRVHRVDAGRDGVANAVEVGNSQEVSTLVAPRAGVE